MKFLIHRLEEFPITVIDFGCMFFKNLINLGISNTHALGNILYTDYIHLFQISGMILLVAMVGAITLTFKRRENVKRQSYFRQIQREKKSAVSLVDVEDLEDKFVFCCTTLLVSGF